MTGRLPLNMVYSLSVFKKDWKPPFKKPLTSWAKFVFEFWKSKAADKPTHLKDLLPAASVEWKSMSDEQKAVSRFTLFVSKCRHISVLNHLFRTMPLPPAKLKNTVTGLRNGMLDFHDP